MTTFILRRLLLAIPTVIGVTILTFILLHIAPGNLAQTLAGENASKARVDIITHELGLNKPWLVQYGIWFMRLVHGDLGFSYVHQATVRSLIGERIGRTLLLMGCALLLSVAVAIPLGVYQAYRRNEVIDRVASAAVFIAWSMPTFWFGTLLIAIFAVSLRWAPVGGLQTIDTTAFDWPSRFSHLVLPVLTLAIVSLAGWSRYVRGSMAEQLREDYTRTALAKGLRPRAVLFRHTLRNALIPFITLLGGTLPALFGGAVITEQIFAYPGMGQLFWQSAIDRDYFTLLGMTVITALLVVIGNLLADVFYAVVDPRVRYD